MIKTIYFDLGNVLVFFSFPKMLKQISNCTKIPPQEVEELLFKSQMRESYEKGLVTTLEVYQTFRKHSPQEFSIEEFSHAFSNIFTPNTDLWPILEELKAKNIRLILLSNISECHYTHVRTHYPILDLFDHKILSYEMGVWKPDTEIFQKALEYSQCRREECFYVDDIPEFIESAKTVGLQGTVFTDVPTLKNKLYTLL